MNKKILKLSLLGILLFAVGCSNTTTTGPITEYPDSTVTTMTPATTTPTTVTSTTKPTSTPTTAKPTTVTPTTTKPTTAPTPSLPVGDFTFKEQEVEDTFNIMSFNIRNENGNDTGNTNWSVRKKYVMDFVKNSNMDIVAFQEVKYTQYRDMAMGNTGYSYLYYPRESSANPEGLMIAYKSTFELIEKDIFWLSEKPDTVGKGYDTQYQRISGNALLCAPNGSYIDVYSVHLGLGSDEVRTNEINVVLNRRKDSSYPKIILGDFNAERSGTTIPYIDGLMVDCQAEATVKDDKFTFNGWDKTLTEGKVIDFIFASEGVKSNSFVVHHEKFTHNGTENLYSDHYAVHANLTVKQKRQNVDNVKAIEVLGPAKVISTEGSIVVEANVVATMNDDTKVSLPKEYYSYKLSDEYNIGKTYNLEITLNGNSSIKTTTTADVHIRKEAELYNEIKGGSANTEPHKILEGGKFVDDKLYTFVGNFDKTVAAGGEGSFKINIDSDAATSKNLSIRAGNGNCMGSKGAYYMAELVLNTIVDLYVNGEQVVIADDVKFEETAKNAEYAPLYQVSYDILIANISLKQGANEIYFKFKTSTIGQKNCWGRSPSTMNVDFVEFC